MIGTHKALIEYSQKDFDVLDVYEMASLAFAAMPYRFLQLQTDSYLIMILLFGVKLILKFWDFYLGPTVG